MIRINVAAAKLRTLTAVRLRKFTMLFFIRDLHPGAIETITHAMRARDPRALVAGTPNSGVRVVGRLTLHHMLGAFAEAGFDAIPEFRVADGSPA